MKVRLKIRVNKSADSSSSPCYTMWRPKYNIHRMKWEINPYDDDNFPSVPHADSIDYNHKYKIDLLDGIGTVYYNREKCGILKGKEYKRLMRDIQDRNLVKIAREYYREHHPEKNLPVIAAERLIVNSRYKRIDKQVRYIFECSWVKSKN